MPPGTENKMNSGVFFPNGNFTFVDKFEGNGLDDRWISLRGPREKFVEEGTHGLVIKPFDVNIKAQQPISTLFYRQQHAAFSASVDMHYKPETEGDLAGLACVQSEAFNYVFGVTKSGADYYLVLERTEKGESSLIARKKLSEAGKISLKVEANGDDYQFAYALDGGDFENLGGTVSGDILSTDVAGGFTGAMIGLYATSANDIKVE